MSDGEQMTASDGKRERKPNALPASLTQWWPAFAGAAAVALVWLLSNGLPAKIGIPFVGVSLVLAWMLRSASMARRQDPMKVLPAVAERQQPAHEAAVMAALPDAVLLIDHDMRLKAMNPVAAELVGKHEAGVPFSFVIRNPQVSEAVRSARLADIPVRVTYSAKVPDDRLFEAHVAPVAAGADKKQSDVLILLRDLTGQQRLERMRSDFVANASHELRTPLASLMGFIETLQGPARNDAAARERFLGIMATQASRMARLIDDLMSLSRIEQKAHLRPSGKVDLTKTIGHVVDALQPIASENGVAIAFSIPENADAFTVTGEPDELMQVFQNLIENAIKYGASGEKVEVSLSRVPDKPGQPDRIEASVRDFGPGIEPEHLPRLTERFYRADVTTSRERGGTGLGLAIVKHILNRHRASLAIDSKVGHGAAFRVRFDAARSD
ncbi:MAG: ATP-binding protein [Tepidamorphaceae bacterium]|nr:hypothetical protein [Rhodobiaceae bacterium]MCC0050143.1 hypothetical protein [Rhodobiaceae bacterium]